MEKKSKKGVASAKASAASSRTRAGTTTRTNGTSRANGSTTTRSKSMNGNPGSGNTRQQTSSSVKSSSAKSSSAKSTGASSAKPVTAGSSKNEGAKTTTNVKGSMLGKFFVEELKDIYWAEKHLVKALSKMAKEATTQELKEAFESHRSETEDQVSRLEEIFEMIGEKAVAKKCDAIEGITKEVESVISDTQDDTYTRDVALIIGGQKAEHYEIATYGGLAQLALVLGYDDAAELLLQTLDEEKSADSTLTSIAENAINEEALTETE
jgi:ferritin-like metal-binding protein YciE